MPATTATTSPTPETIASARSRPVALPTRSRPHLSAPTCLAFETSRRLTLSPRPPPTASRASRPLVPPCPPPARISKPCQRPHTAHIARAGNALSRTIFRRAGPGAARNAEGTVCFSDPQHSVVWRLPVPPPPSRDHLQFRFISADYPTAGQKRRLTTCHRP